MVAMQTKTMYNSKQVKNNCTPFPITAPILSFTVDSSELFYLIFIFYFECLVRSQS